MLVRKLGRGGLLWIMYRQAARLQTSDEYMKKRKLSRCWILSFRTWLEVCTAPGISKPPPYQGIKLHENRWSLRSWKVALRNFISSGPTSTCLADVVSLQFFLPFHFLPCLKPVLLGPSFELWTSSVLRDSFLLSSLRRKTLEIDFNKSKSWGICLCFVLT